MPDNIKGYTFVCPFLIFMGGAFLSKKVKRDFLIGVMPGENSVVGAQSGETGIGIFDMVLEQEEETKGD